MPKKLPPTTESLVKLFQDYRKAAIAVLAHLEQTDTLAEELKVIRQDINTLAEAQIYLCCKPKSESGKGLDKVFATMNAYQRLETLLTKTRVPVFTEFLQHAREVAALDDRAVRCEKWPDTSGTYITYSPLTIDKAKLKAAYTPV